MFVRLKCKKEFHEYVLKYHKYWVITVSRASNNITYVSRTKFYTFFFVSGLDFSLELSLCLVWFKEINKILSAKHKCLCYVCCCTWVGDHTKMRTYSMYPGKNVVPKLLFWCDELWLQSFAVYLVKLKPLQKKGLLAMLVLTA